MGYETIPVKWEEMDRTDFRTEEAVVYEILRDGIKFEFLVRYHPDSRQAVVFGTGSVDRPCQLPVFARSGWGSCLPCTGIWYFDPTVYRGDAKLYWGYGDNGRWYLEEIAEILRKLFGLLQLDQRGILYFGSSGGGFTSLLLASMLRGRAAVINPQFIVENYWPQPVTLFRQTVLKEGEELIPERVSASRLFQREGYVPPIHVSQNVKAVRDIEMQLTPFLKELAELPMNPAQRLRVEFYSAEGGHGGMPAKEDCLRRIRRELERALEECRDEEKPDGASNGEQNDGPGKSCSEAQSPERAAEPFPIDEGDGLPGAQGLSAEMAAEEVPPCCDKAPEEGMDVSGDTGCDARADRAEAPQDSEG